MKNLLFLLLPFLLVCCNNNEDETKTLTIASQQGDCVGVAPMKCLLIKEKGATEWSFFYSNIEDFNYEPGYEYVLKVKVEKKENPPMDSSSVKYTLVKEVSKTKKESENMPPQK